VMSAAVEHGRFLLTATNPNAHILLPTASKCKSLCTKERKSHSRTLPNLVAKGGDA
jgi:hypothetical protein